MKPDPITLISSAAGALSLGTLGAFLLYVSPITIIAMLAILTALIMVFGLGVLWGRQWRHHAGFVARLSSQRSAKKPTDSGSPSRLPAHGVSEFL
jgi:hypothetical protein